MKLLCEMIEDIKVIKEDNELGSKTYFLEGIFLQGELQNRNGRVYPMDVLDEEVGKYSKTFVTKNRAFGELGHPENPAVNLDRVSHVIVGLTKEGNNYIGKAKILDTPNGKIVKAFMDEGCQLGVSSRGLGTLKQVGNQKVVQKDFMLTTAADIVWDPSAPEAFVTGLVENAEWVVEAGVWTPKFIEESQKDVRNLSVSKEEREQKLLNIFEEFMAKLSNRK
jgi:hypothetical protein